MFLRPMSSPSVNDGKYPLDGRLHHTLFGTDESFRYLMMAVVGGVGSSAGGLVAALVLTIVPEGLRRLGETNLRLLVYGTMVLFVLWFLPRGIGGLLERVPRLPPSRREN